MKAMPESRLSPLPASAVRGRPWWTVVRQEYMDPDANSIWQEAAARRRDGRTVRVGAPQPDIPAALATEAARVDGEFPLPAPPLRAGQVWLIEAHNGQTLTSAVLNTTLPGILVYAPGPGTGIEADRDVPAFEMSLHSRAFLQREYRGMVAPVHCPGWVLGDRYLTQHNAEDLLLRGTWLNTRAYLLFDPVDPTCAPWSAP